MSPFASGASKVGEAGEVLAPTVDWRAARGAAAAIPWNRFGDMVAAQAVTPSFKKARRSRAVTKSESACTGVTEANSRATLPARPFPCTGLRSVENRAA